MIKSIDLTDKVIAYSEVPNFDPDDCIDWAIEMLLSGFDSATLRILAGLQKPVNYFEAIECLKKSGNELGIEILTGDKAVRSYTGYYIKKMAEGQAIRENLTLVFQYSQMRDCEPIVYDFYLLYWAWQDFDLGQEFSPYWDNSNPKTIQTIVMNEAKKWLDRYK